MLTVAAPIASGTPAPRRTCRAGFWPAPAWIDIPKRTSWTSSGRRPARSIAARAASVPKSRRGYRAKRSAVASDGRPHGREDRDGVFRCPHHPCSAAPGLSRLRAGRELPGRAVPCSVLFDSGSEEIPTLAAARPHRELDLKRVFVADVERRLFGGDRLDHRREEVERVHALHRFLRPRAW